MSLVQAMAYVLFEIIRSDAQDEDYLEKHDTEKSDEYIEFNGPHVLIVSEVEEKKKKD